MTHLKQARERLREELGAQPHCSGFSHGAEFILGFLDEQEKHPASVSCSGVGACHLCTVAQLTKVSRVCEHEMLPRLKCTKPKGHEGNHGTDEVQPTPVPEELKNIGCPCRCRGMDMCPHNERKICGCRNCTLESKLNELIRWARSLQPRNQ